MILAKYYIEVTMAEIIARVDMIFENDVDIKDQDILDQIRYHHSRNIKQADLNKDSLAYITYIADNIASGLDRRDKEDGEGGFVRDIALESIFNILNHNKGNEHYRPAMLGRIKRSTFQQQIRYNMMNLFIVVFIRRYKSV